MAPRWHCAKRIIDQTERQVLQGEKVPTDEKVVSLFEEHTDIIKTENRKTVVRHKLFLTGDVSGLTLECEVERRGIQTNGPSPGQDSPASATGEASSPRRLPPRTRCRRSRCRPRTDT